MYFGDSIHQHPCTGCETQSSSSLLVRSEYHCIQIIERQNKQSDRSAGLKVYSLLIKMLTIRLFSPGYKFYLN